MPRVDGGSPPPPARPSPARPRVPAGEPAGARPARRRFIAPTLDLGCASALPRKEVIQPQLPLRLPCYDFVPITRPTLDGCLPEGLAHRLQVLPAFVT
jgi:hypothetical protein